MQVVGKAGQQITMRPTLLLCWSPTLSSQRVVNTRKSLSVFAWYHHLARKAFPGANMANVQLPQAQSSWHIKALLQDSQKVARCIHFKLQNDMQICVPSQSASPVVSAACRGLYKEYQHRNFKVPDLSSKRHNCSPVPVISWCCQHSLGPVFAWF